MNIEKFLDIDSQVVTIRRTTEFETGKLSDIEEAIKKYFEAYWYEQLRFSVYDQYDNLIFIEFKCPEGYEGQIELHYEDEFFANVNTEKEAMAELNRLFMEKI